MAWLRYSAGAAGDMTTTSTTTFSIVVRRSIILPIMPRSSTPLLSPIAFVLLLVAPAQAQTYQLLIGGTDMDGALATARTADGGYALAGFTRSFGLPGEEAYLVKTNAMGNVVWSRVYSAAGDDRFMGIAPASDGGMLLCGSTTSFSNTDILLIRTDANGDTLWCRTVGDAANNAAYAAVQADDGGFLVCGASAAIAGNGSDLYLLRTDASGDTLWTRCFGGMYGDWANAVRKTPDGDYLIAGSTSTFGVGQEDCYLLKVDDNGTLLFSRTYGGPVMDQAWALALTADGGCIMAGSTDSFGIPTRGVYLVRTDAVGDTLWTGVYYDDNMIFGGWGYAVAECTDGGFVVGGESVDLKVDLNGEFVWSNTLLTSTTPVHTFCEAQPDGGVLFTGYGGYVVGGLGWSDMHMVRTDATGWSGCNQTPIPLASAHTPTVVSSPATAQLTCAMTVAPAPFTVVTGANTAVLCLALGTDGAEAEESLIAAPNPSDGVFMLRYTHGAAHAVEVHDALGACVLRTVVPASGRLQLDLRQMPVGLYVVTANDGQRTLHTRVIIER